MQKAYTPELNEASREMIGHFKKKKSLSKSKVSLLILLSPSPQWDPEGLSVALICHWKYNGERSSKTSGGEGGPTTYIWALNVYVCFGAGRWN